MIYNEQTLLGGAYPSVSKLLGEIRLRIRSIQPRVRIL